MLLWWPPPCPDQSSSQTSSTIATQLSSQLPSFCFPHGVHARLVERTPSRSEVDRVRFGAGGAGAAAAWARDRFVFTLKVGDGANNELLYGCVVLAEELVGRAPAVARQAARAAAASEDGRASRCARRRLAAPMMMVMMREGTSPHPR